MSPCWRASQGGTLPADTAAALTALDNVIAPLLPYRTSWNKRERGRQLLAAVSLATHDPQIAARCDRLIRLRDGALVDDIDLTESYPADDTLRRIGQLG
jgi:predicted ABC-type transport system involved in lysophospholipase L1 biosynthesis ATPase subunit